MAKQSPVQRVWKLGREEHGRLMTAVLLAVLGAVSGVAPYFAAAKIIVLLIAGEKAQGAHAPWLMTALAGYLLRTLLYNGALSISHRATFSILKTIRQKLLAKLPRLPLGTVMDTSSGHLKEIIVDQVERRFAGNETKNINRSVAVSFLNALLQMTQVGAIYCVVRALTGGERSGKIALIALALELISIFGGAVASSLSKMLQPHAGYFMAADRRVAIADRLKSVPMAFSTPTAWGRWPACVPPSWAASRAWCPWCW